MTLMGYRGRHNLEKQQHEWYLPHPLTGKMQWRGMSKDEWAWALVRLWEEYGWKVKTTEEKQLQAYVCMRNMVRPTFNWLQARKVDPALSHITLENWLAPWLVNPDGELERWASKAILVQIVSRILGDSKPQRINVTLRGPGDCGKSILVQSLLPEELDATGDLNLASKDRNILSQLTSGYLVELSELNGMNRKDAGSLKSLLGAGAKKMRKLYHDGAVKREYTSAIVGTVNYDPILYDDEALISRFVFVDVLRTIDPAIEIPRIRDHLFALALQAYQVEGFESNILPEHLKARQFEQAAISVNSARTLNDLWSEIRLASSPGPVQDYRNRAIHGTGARSKTLLPAQDGFGIGSFPSDKGFRRQERA